MRGLTRHYPPPRALLPLVAAVALATGGAGVARGHSGGWGATRGIAQHDIVARTLYPRGDYEGVVIDAIRARCRGDFNSRNWVQNNQRWFNHLFCTLWDTEGRVWSLKYHATSQYNWQYSNLREGSSSGGSSSGPQGITAFRSPSGNITCVITVSAGNGRFAQCELNSMPYGGGFHIDQWSTVSRYDVGYDDIADRRFTLAYGHSIRRGPFTCTSETVGMTCRSVSSGHGFFLSRERQRTF